MTAGDGDSRRRERTVSADALNGIFILYQDYLYTDDQRVGAASSGALLQGGRIGGPKAFPKNFGETAPATLRNELKILDKMFKFRLRMYFSKPAT
jgi:hypothetical protein